MSNEQSRGVTLCFYIMYFGRCAHVAVMESPPSSEHARAGAPGTAVHGDEDGVCVFCLPQKAKLF